MPDRILIVEQDLEHPHRWRYGLADDQGQLPAGAYELDARPERSGPPADTHGASLWVTAMLLVRQARGRTRIVYDLTLRPVAEDPDPPPRPPERRWTRSTSGKSKGAGETLSERAERDREGRPRAAA